MRRLSHAFYSLLTICAFILLTRYLFFIYSNRSTGLTDGSVQVGSASQTNGTGQRQNFPYVAVLIEFRAVAMLVTIVHNVHYHLPDSWRIQIFHGKGNHQFIVKSSLKPLIKSQRIILTQMNTTYGRERTSELLTDRNFWNQVLGEKVLIFQIDSIMCSNSRHKIDEYLQYDYIGAPWDPSWFSYGTEQLVGNGGFSLRTRSKILELLDRIRYNGSMPEDVWYSKHLPLVKARIAPREIAKTFAVETVYYDRPLAVHKTILLCHVVRTVIETCPEAKLVISDECSRQI